MKKRIISFLLSISLAVGLLPVVAYAATPADTPIKFGNNSYKLDGYDNPVYTVNYSKETQDVGGNPFVKWGQTSDGANESNYNAKYEWKSGDPGPTLTLRGFQLDEWNNDAGKLEAKVSDGAYTATSLATTAITADADAPLTIIIEENSLIEAKFGITFKSDTTILSKNGATLTINGYSSCIASNNTAGADLTVNANLDLTLLTYYNAAYGGAVMHTYQADLTINGGNTRCTVENPNAKSIKGIATRSGGDLIINGGIVTAASVNSVSAVNACISAEGKLIVNGGTVSANSVKGVGIYSSVGIAIYGGNVNAVSQNLYGFNAGTSDTPADIIINGGTVESKGSSAFYVVPTLGEGMGGFAGPSEAEADYFDETKYRAEWVKLSETTATPSTGDTTVKPYYGIGTSDFNRIQFPNLEGRIFINVRMEDGEVYLYTNSAGRDIHKIAAITKSALDRYPEGLRSITLHNISAAFQLKEDAIYFEEGIEKLKAAFTEFIQVYSQIGGKLDSLVLDLEYVNTYAWYIYSREYYLNNNLNNTEIYQQIVDNPLYATQLRPMLVERGFQFYADSSKPEIWSIFPRLKGAEAEEYAVSQTVWNTVMRIRLNNYLTEAVYAPLAQYMPGTQLYDYQSRNTYAWLKDLSDKGAHTYVAGNSVAVGVTSHHNSYGSRLSDEFFTVDGQPVYNKPVSYNGAEFAPTPFNRILWDVNLMKNMYEASGGDVSITVAEYDYSPDKLGTPSNTPYYTESVFHIGLLDPDPFCIYMYDQDFTTEAYNARAQVLQEIMAELTRVAGYADRKPISVPATWNSSFLLSGIYANGRNLWRLTPDTTQASLEDFKIQDSDPTFCINGQTITFPQGQILADGHISVVGTCGYWIETPKDVTPVITSDKDRYSKYPAFWEDFSDFTTDSTWSIYGDTPLVENGALALLGTTTLEHSKLPQNITSGDYYAKQQVWEISLTLPEDMISGNMHLLMTPSDGGFMIEDGKVYYTENTGLRAFSDLTLTAGRKYTLRRELDFKAFTCTYSVCADGILLAQAADVQIQPFTLPVNKISFSFFDLTTQVLLDDYKLYAAGLTADLELYDGSTGMLLTDGQSEMVAYRLSWMNATGEAAMGQLRVTRYDSNGNLVSDSPLQAISMLPGCDGIETGVIENTTGKLAVYLHTCEKANTRLQNQKAAACGEDGYTGDLVCKDCGEIFEKGAVIPAIPHQEITIPGKDPTCTETGLTEGRQCSACGKILAEQEEISTLDHEWIYVPGKAPTCTGAGFTESEYCELCGDISIEPEILEATGIHTYHQDFDTDCNVCGAVRVLNNTYRLENYRVVFSDPNTTHKSLRIEVYKLGDKTVADPTNESALRAIDSGYKTYWGTGNINKILITDAGNYVLLLKYNVGTGAATKVPMVISVSAAPKLTIDKNNKITVHENDATNLYHRVNVYYLGQQTVEDIYNESALKSIDPEAKTIWNIRDINRITLTKGGNYVLHLCYNKSGSAKQTVAQQFTVASTPSLSISLNNMPVATEENAENKNHRMTVFYLGSNTVEDIYSETSAAAVAISVKTCWGLAEINKFEAKEGGNYIFHLYYNVGTSAKRTLAIAAALTERPALRVDTNGKISVSYTDPEINNPRAYIYNVGDAEIPDIYDEAALKRITTPTQVWGLSSILKKQLTPGTYVIHFYYSVGTSAKKTVAIKVTI